MNRSEYMAALRRALAALPEEERANALRYYEEYFDDAGPAEEARVIAALGDPAHVAAQLLADYRELTAVPPQAAGAASAPKRRRCGISPWLLVVLLLLAIPVGIPLAGALLGVIVAVLGAFAAVLVAVGCVLIAVPLCLLVAGGALCLFSCWLWHLPASAVMTLGCGLALLALGVLAVLLSIKLCTLFVPPLVRGVVAVLRWPFDKLRRRQQGGDAA